MILVELWHKPHFDGSPPDKYLSDTGYEMDGHWWDNAVSAFSGFTNKLSGDYGGVIQPSYGTISFGLEVFGTVPTDTPVQCAKIYYADRNGSLKTLLYYGQLSLNAINYLRVTFDLFPDVPNVKTGELDTGITSINTVFQGFVDSAIISTGENWLLDANDESHSIYIDRTFSDVVFADALASMCEDVGYFYWIDAGRILNNVHTPTIYLRSMVENVLEHDKKFLDEFQFLPVEYPMRIPPSVVRVGIEKAFNGVAWFGQDITVGDGIGGPDQDLIIADKILAILTKPYMEIRVPTSYFLYNQIAFGDVIKWEDTKVLYAITCEMTIRGVVFNTDTNTVTLTGEGSITA